MHARVFVAALLTAAYAGAGCGSSPTNPTPPPAACTYQLSSSTQTLGSAAGTATITVTTTASCTWSASVDQSWLSIASGGSGTGNGTVTVAVAENATTTAREGNVTVGGQRVTLRQEARASSACQYEVSTTSQRVGPSGGTGPITIRTGADCGWTAASSESWLTVSPSTGTGDATITYTIQAWTGTTERAATVTVADRSVTIRQDPNLAACQYSVSPVTVDACFYGYTGLELRISAGAGCPWTVAPAVPWLSTSVSSGEGDQTVRYNIAAYTDEPTRTGQIEVRWPSPTQGQNVWVTQTGCRYAVNPQTLTVGAAGATGLRMDVFGTPVDNNCGGPMSTGCPWTASVDVSWITLSRTTGTGDDTVFYNVAANGTGAARTGRITLQGKTLVITQNP